MSRTSFSDFLNSKNTLTIKQLKYKYWPKIDEKKFFGIFGFQFVAIKYNDERPENRKKTMLVRFMMHKAYTQTHRLCFLFARFSGSHLNYY